MAKLKAHIPRSLASAIPDPILYQHGQVGFCNDLLFGISLVDYATAKGLQDGEVPKIIRICIREIDQRGLESEGIYRVCFVWLIDCLAFSLSFRSIIRCLVDTLSFKQWVSFSNQ